MLAWARGAGGPWLPAEEPAPEACRDVAQGVLSRVPPAGSDSSRLRRERPAGASRAGVSPARVPPATASPASVPMAPMEPVDEQEREEGLRRMAAEVATCRRCVLAGTRHETVFGEGSHEARLLIVGEAPGAEEDRSGRPFVGAAGQLLTRMLAAIGLAREDVYICNLLKCRPPDNRTPRPDEIACCKPFLQEQVRLIQPELILAMGSPAARELLRTSRGITSLRGRFTRTAEGHRVMPTFHPAYLLRNPAAKRDVWADLQSVAAELGLEIPGRPGK